MEQHQESQFNGNYLIIKAQQQLVFKDEVCDLTQRESLLLDYLNSCINQMLKREEILETIWEVDNFFAGRSLDVFISLLRKYLQQDTTLLLRVCGRIQTSGGSIN